MRFKNFLREARHRQDISLEKAEDLLRAHCSEALKHADTPLVRGTKKSTEEAYLIQAELGGRESRNLSNHYTIIFDEILPPLGYPLRSKSIILANWDSREYAETYGTLYAILPYDGVKIGVTPHEDIWDTYINMGRDPRKRSLEMWNIFFEKAGVPDYTFEDMITYLEEVLEDPEDDAFDSVSDVFRKGQVEEAIREAYEPDSTGFKLMTTADVYTKSSTPHELWIGGKCIGIRLSEYEQLMKSMGVK